MKYGFKSIIFLLFGLVYTVGYQVSTYILNDSVRRLSVLYRISETTSPELVDTKSVTSQILGIYRYINTATILQVLLQWFVAGLIVVAIFQAYKAYSYLEVGISHIGYILKLFGCVFVIIATGFISMQLLGATFLFIFLGIENILSMESIPNYYHANFAFLED